MREYLLNNFIAFDQQLNALLRGAPDETMSSRAHRMREKGQPVWGWTANTIDFFAWHIFRDADHCRSSYGSELTHKQLWRGADHVARTQHPEVQSPH